MADWVVVEQVLPTGGDGGGGQGTMSDMLQYMDLSGVPARHEPVRDAVLGGTARDADRALLHYYVSNTNHALCGAPSAR